MHTDTNKWFNEVLKPGEGNGNPPQCSYLQNPRDRGAWQATVYGVAKSWTWLLATKQTQLQADSLLSELPGKPLKHMHTKN